MGRATLYTSSSRRDPRLYCCTATVARPRYTSSSGCGRLCPHGATHAPLEGCGMLLRRHRSHAGLACHLAELLHVHVTALGGDNACDLLQPSHVLHVALNVLRSCSESMWPLSRGRQCYRSPSIFASLCQCITANLRRCSASISPLFEEDNAFAKRPSLLACARVSLAILRSCATSMSPLCGKTVLSLDVHRCSPVRVSRLRACGVAQRPCRRFRGRQCFR